MKIVSLSRTLWGAAAVAISFEAAAAAPAVTLSPKVGPPTTNITVKGSGFGASQLIDIYFDTADECLAASSGTGAFSCTIKAPASAGPQSHWITAAQRSNGTAAQAAFTIRTDWAQFHGMNAKHNGYNPYENTINAQNVRNLDVLWMASIGSLGTYSTPTVVGGRVYIGALDNKFYSFSNKTGAPFAGWPKTLGAPVYDSSAAVGQGHVYIGTRDPDDKLYAFDAVTGNPIANFPVTLGGAVFSPPTLYGGNVYVGAADGKIYAFNATTAAALPGFPIIIGGSSADAAVSAANGRIFDGSFNGHFYSFDATTGASIPGFTGPVAGGQIESTAAIVGGQVFFGTVDHNLYGIRRRDGAALSGFPSLTSGAVASSPAVADALVIAGSTDTNVYSDYTTGGFHWNATLDDAVQGSPIIANGVVFVNSLRSLYALDESTGAILWRASVDTSALASPTVADGIVYLGSTDGNLYAFSVNGVLPSSLLPGGENGIRPAISSLMPDYSLKLRN